MYDDFEEEMDEGPQGSIVTPILLGCGAMGLGCVFSLGAIVIALMVFVPGLWGLINTISEDGVLMEETLPLVMANERVIAAVGEPVETDFVDIDLQNEDDVAILLGEELNFISEYTITGPLGTAEVAAEGNIDTDGDSDREWTITSVTVRLKDGTLIHVVPTEVDTPPAPAQLAPPEAPAVLEDQTDDTPLDNTSTDD